MTEHSIDYRPCLQIARALREQVDWNELRRRTGDSPFAEAFLTLAHGLGIIPADVEPASLRVAARDVEVAQHGLERAHPRS
jgi:hypothetical protein